MFDGVLNTSPVKIGFWKVTQLTFTFSKSMTEILEKGVEYV